MLTILSLAACSTEPTSTSTPVPTATPTPVPTPSLRAGLRSSGYGISPFPKPDWWLDSTASMSESFDNSAPAVVWIVGTVARGGYSWLTFPQPEGKDISDYENIIFTYTDRNEEYLNQFDEMGVKVWLQVEPSAADIGTLIDLVIGRYAHHPSVVGFGVDVEWFLHEEYSEGKAVTDAEAQAWVDKTRSYNPDYLVFTKHWLIEKMPPTVRDGMMFLDDSQGFTSLDQMVAEFIDWGKAFEPAPVGFQYGYPADRPWWGEFENPPAEIGQELLANIPNTADLVWVDFTAEEIWPQDW